MNLYPAVGEEIGQWKLVRVREMSSELWAGRCYDVRHQKTGQMGFCEVEIPSEDWPAMDHHRFKAMIVKETTLLGSASLQRFIEYGNAADGRYAYLITEALGPKLHLLRNSLPPIAENRFTLATGLYIGQKMLFALQERHEAGYLHRSVKDEYFALDRKFTSELVLIGLTGLLRRWLKFDGSGALPARVFAVFRGNLAYTSANVLRQREQHRLDDVWSWFYLIVDMTVGILPWTHLTLNGDIHDQMRVFAYAKEAANQETTWLDTAPPEFKKILEYLKTTPSDAEPAYSRLANLLGSALKRTVDENGGEFKLDWEPGGAYYEELHSLLANDEQ